MAVRDDQDAPPRGGWLPWAVMGLSIGITETRNRAFTHYGEITENAAEMKKFAKKFSGSCYKTDKRQRGLPVQGKL